MIFLNKQSNNFIVLSPFLGENAPVPIDLWNAQIIWTSLVGLSTVPVKLGDDVSPQADDLPKR